MAAEKPPPQKRPQVPFGAPMRHAHFAFSPNYTPLNHGSYGTHPVSVRAAHLAVRAEVEAAPDPFIALDFADRLLRSRTLTAGLLGCPVDELVFVPNATTGIDTVLKNLAWGQGRDGKTGEKVDDVVLCYEVVYGAVAHGLSYMAESAAGKGGGGGVEVEVLRTAWPLGDDDLVAQYVAKVREVNARPGKRARLAVVDTIVSGPGMRIPFEKLVPALQAEGCLVMVDGAHGIGHIELDLGRLAPDFFVTNLHKWLFMPRGCAAFYVPRRHQKLIRTSLPTSHGFRPLRPLEEGEEGSGDGTEGFCEMFDFTGTADTTNWLCVEEAIRFRNEVCGGEEAIRDYCSSIARRGADIAAAVLGTDIMDHPASRLRDCNFANVRLPLDPAAIPRADRVVDWIKRTGVAESGIYYQTMLYRGVFYWRLSGMVYLEEADFRKGAEVLRGLCERIRKGEHEEKKPKRIMPGVVTAVAAGCVREQGDVVAGGESTSAENTPPETPVTPVDDA